MSQTGRQIRGLMQDKRWEAVEEFLRSYIEKNFVQTSLKRDSEFETIWYAAEFEGGKRHLQQFMNELEAEAHKADE